MQSVVVNRDKERTAKILKSLNIKVSQRDAQHADAKVTDAPCTVVATQLHHHGLVYDVVLCLPGISALILETPFVPPSLGLFLFLGCRSLQRRCCRSGCHCRVLFWT